MEPAELIRIAQISDIHIGPDEQLVQGIDVRSNFLTALDAVKQDRLDLLVISGDIAAEDGEEGAYVWVSEVMKSFPYPWVVMGGNHDHIDTMGKYFDIQKDLKNGMLYFRREIKGRHLFFLDTSPDALHVEQLEWLVREAGPIEDEVMLFMHHPPAKCGCLFMDTRGALKNIDQTRAYLRRLPYLHNIFVGHYHTEKLVVQDGKNIHLTPSTFMQIDTGTPGFRMEHVRPGWRTIEWYDGRLDTEVHYGLDAPENASEASSIFP